MSALHEIAIVLHVVTAILGLIGALGGISRGRIRKAWDANGDLVSAYLAVEKMAWAMCSAVALAAVLMVLKPG